MIELKSFYKMPPKVAMARRWRFTIHAGHLIQGNGDQNTIHTWFEWIKSQETLNGVRYLVCQKEQGGNTEREHIQGYVHYSTVKRASTVGNQLRCMATAFQTVNGSPEENRAYCTKLDTRLANTIPFEYGDCPGNQGSKLKDVATAILNKGIVQSINDYPETYLSHSTGMHKLANFYQIQQLRGKRRPEPVNLFVAFGEAGSGKTYWADNYDPQQTFTLPEQSKGGPTWFDGYEGERTLVIQDFDKSVLNYRTLLRMCDETFHQFKIHGGYTIGQWDTIIITANAAPNEWYDYRINPWYYDGHQVGPLQRRVTKLFQGTGRWPANQWFEGTSPIIDMPTRDTIDEEGPAEVAGDQPAQGATTPLSATVEPSPEQPGEHTQPMVDAGLIPPDTEDAVLGDLSDQDAESEDQENDLMRGINPHAFMDPDNYHNGGYGDPEPANGISTLY